MIPGVSAALNLTMYVVDVIYAYTNASAGDILAYLAANKVYEEWWNRTAKLREKHKINCKYVLLIQHCLQGSLESRKQWISK